MEIEPGTDKKDIEKNTIFIYEGCIRNLRPGFCGKSSQNVRDVE